MASRHSDAILLAISGEAKREVLKKEDADFLTKLGTDGARMQRELAELLEKVSADEAAAFLRRIATHDNPAEPAGGGVETPGPA